MPRLASAAIISARFRVFDSSLSKYRNVLSNCSSCAGVRFVMFRETIFRGQNQSYECLIVGNGGIYLVINECNFLGNAVDNQFEFKGEILVCENGVIVLLHIGCFTLRLHSGHTSQCIR